ncbi:alkaline phosphatase D family protein [Marinimicrobium sp. ARAG 43.8]|uniref:alkaline phosphatase D family protein n=1 Tax=Marinimicrobium sp. ARAG 43.8 TaxID=3418719 RepID=UPI003CF7389D
MKRRDFIKAASVSLGAAMAVPSAAALAAAKRERLTSVRPLAASIPVQQQTWLGADFWGNRLQDWQARDGRIECLRGDQNFECRTVSLLTRSLNNRHEPARIRVTVGTLDPGAGGFCGLLLGVGGGKLDYRSASLAQRFSGVGGGFMATLDTNGGLGFRDFSDHAHPLAYEAIVRERAIQGAPVGEREIVLDCHIDPVPGGRFDVRLVAFDAESEQELGFVVRTGVLPHELEGGVMLVSSPSAEEGAGARWWFKDVQTGGKKVTEADGNALGPVMGCMYSLNGKTLKLTAQFMPLSTDAHPAACLEVKRKKGDVWQRIDTARIEDGYIARFRRDDWTSSEAYDYRITFAESQPSPLFEGSIAADSGGEHPLNIALFSCILPTAKSLDDGFYKPAIPQERTLGRYTLDNILFPHRELVSNCQTHDPDLFVFCGDQYYETYPTRVGRDTPDAKLDTLYRWYLWYWTFRDSIRHKPSIVLVDDHDILQGNLWGQGGVSGGDAEEDGGFKHEIDLVRMVYRVQCGHNPDGYDPTPIKGGIPVSYGSFIYGGVNFAFVEDRKFKSPPDYDADPLTVKGELLGERQERFLAEWAETYPELPKMVLTASIWGSPQTDEHGKPLLDYDANGYPPDGRRRALQLIQKAGAIVLSGDQHLGMMCVQGVDDYEDGPLFFSGPAAAAFWQRWFEGYGKLENPRNDDPNTGHFVDTFGNKMRVLAVANPRVSHATFEEGNDSWGKFLFDHRLKSEGYGLVRVNTRKQKVVFECWPWQADPKKDDQFEGWPLEVSL